MPSVGGADTEATVGVSSKSDVSESEEDPKTAWMALHVAGPTELASLAVGEHSESEVGWAMSEGVSASRRGASATTAADGVVGCVCGGEKNDLGNGVAGLRRVEGVRRSGVRV